MVVVDVQNFTLVDATDAPPNADGEGHFHVEYPGSYAVCYKPYCLVDLSSIANEDGSESTPTLTAVLTGNDHAALTDENGNRIEASLPIRLKKGECTEGTPMSGYDDTGDSG